MIMETRFDSFLVTLSVIVAILASYIALNFAQNLTQSKGRSRILWLVSGALAMGIGIWSMHFVGMLAFQMPGMTMAYDVPLMIVSVIVAIVDNQLLIKNILRLAGASVEVASNGKEAVEPIIALTAHAMKEERQRTLSSGFTDHITKPIDRELLIQLLAEYPRLQGT